MTVEIVDHGGPCDICATPPTWTTVTERRLANGFDVTTKLPEFDGVNLQASVSAFVNQQLDEYLSGEHGGYIDITAEVTLASPTLTAVQLRIDSFSTGAAHPNVGFASLLLDGDGNPLDTTAALKVPRVGGDPYGPWDGPFASILEEQADQAVERVVGRESMPPSGWAISGGLLSPGLEGVIVAYDRCQLSSCAMGAVRVVVPYAALDEIGTPLLNEALAGPVAAGD